MHKDLEALCGSNGHEIIVSKGPKVDAIKTLSFTSFYYSFLAEASETRHQMLAALHFNTQIFS